MRAAIRLAVVSACATVAVVTPVVASDAEDPDTTYTKVPVNAAARSWAVEQTSRSADRTPVIPEPTPASTPSEPPPPPTPVTPSTATSNSEADPVSGSGGGLPPLLLTIRANESGGNYQAYNPTGCIGGCYGAYQMTAEYMGGWAVEAGYPEYNYAGFWPPEIQDAVALYKFYATNPDGAMWCSFTEYC